MQKISRGRYQTLVVAAGVVVVIVVVVVVVVAAVVVVLVVDVVVVAIMKFRRSGFTWTLPTPETLSYVRS